MATAFQVQIKNTFLNVAVEVDEHLGGTSRRRAHSEPRGYHDLLDDRMGLAFDTDPVDAMESPTSDLLSSVGGCGKADEDSASVSTPSIVDSDDESVSPSSLNPALDDASSGLVKEVAEFNLAAAHAELVKYLKPGVQTRCRHVQYWSSKTSEVCWQRPLPPPPAYAPTVGSNDNFCGLMMAVQSESKPLRWADEDPSEDLEDVQTIEKQARTLMVRNIACRYTRQQVVGFLSDLGFEDCYDFLYLPLNSMQRANLGYFFINLTSDEDCERFRATLQGRVFGKSQTEKRCDVSIARLQGNKHLNEHFEGKAVMRTSRAPLFIEKAR